MKSKVNHQYLFCAHMVSGLEAYHIIVTDYPSNLTITMTLLVFSYVSEDLSRARIELRDWSDVISCRNRVGVLPDCATDAGCLVSRSEFLHVNGWNDWTSLVFSVVCSLRPSAQQHTNYLHLLFLCILFMLQRTYKILRQHYASPPEVWPDVSFIFWDHELLSFFRHLIGASM